MTTADLEPRHPHPCFFVSREVRQPPQANEASIIRDPDIFISLSDHIGQACQCELSSYLLIHATVYGNFPVDKETNWADFTHVQTVEVPDLPDYFLVFRLENNSGQRLIVCGRDTGYTRTMEAGHKPPLDGFGSFLDEFIQTARSFFKDGKKLSELLQGAQFLD